MFEKSLFKDRTEAGKLLAKKIARLGMSPECVLAIPRGGVPVGKEIANHFNIPLRLMLVRKIGHPSNEEYAIGAVSKKNILLSDVEKINPAFITKQIQKERGRIAEMEVRFGNVWDQTETAKHLLLTDDGIATGQCMELAINELKKNNGLIISVAVPVCPVNTFVRLQKLVDHFICLKTPGSFTGIGAYYEDFSQLTDREVVKMITFIPTE